MRSLIAKTIAIATMSTLSAGAANAAIISNTYAVVGSNFTSSVPSIASPYTSITESFTISFDNTVSVTQQTAGISLNASTITPSSTLSYTYFAILDALFVGGSAATPGASDGASTDFALAINNASRADFGITSLTYSVGQGAVFSAFTTTRAAAVPEPASLAVLGIAAAGLGVFRRYQSVSSKKKIVDAC